MKPPTSHSFPIEIMRHLSLLGGLEHELCCSIREFHHPNWRSLIFFRRVGLNSIIINHHHWITHSTVDVPMKYGSFLYLFTLNQPLDTRASIPCGGFFPPIGPNHDPTTRLVLRDSNYWGISLQAPGSKKWPGFQNHQDDILWIIYG